jgi:uncharacterized membrane protein
MYSPFGPMIQIKALQLAPCYQMVLTHVSRSPPDGCPTGAIPMPITWSGQMNSAEADPATEGSDEQRAAPPGSKLVVVMFPNKAKVDRAIGAILTKLAAGDDVKVNRLAVVEKRPDGKISLRDISEDGHGTVGAGALIGGLSGLAGGPLGAAIGASAGALFGWSAELVNEQAVDEFANKEASELEPGRRAIVAEVAEEAAPAFDALMEANGGTVRA